MTFELAWNITKYFCVNPDCEFDNVSFTAFDSPNDGDTLPDSIRANFSIDSILPSDKVMVNASLCDQNDNDPVVWVSHNYTIPTLSQSNQSNITFSIPDESIKGITNFNFVSTIQRVVSIKSSIQVMMYQMKSRILILSICIIRLETQLPVTSTIVLWI